MIVYNIHLEICYHAVLKFHPVFNLQSYYVMFKEVKSYHVQFLHYSQIFFLRRIRRSLFFAIQVLKVSTLLLKVGNMVLNLALNIHPESCQLVLVRLYFFNQK